MRKSWDFHVYKDKLSFYWWGMSLQKSWDFLDSLETEKASTRQRVEITTLWTGLGTGGKAESYMQHVDWTEKVPPGFRLWRWRLEWKGRDAKARGVAMKRKHEWGDHNKCLYATWPWSSSLPSLSLSLLICTTGNNRAVIRVQQISICRAVCGSTEGALRMLGKHNMLGLFLGQAWRGSQTWAALSAKVSWAEILQML